MTRGLSVYLDLARFVAALVVFLAHANYHRFTGGLPALGWVSELGNDAVTVFFVLSGFVIAYISKNKEASLLDYSASRLARLWSVSVPALFLTMVLDAIGSRITPTLYDGQWFQADFPVLRFVSSLLFVNELWFFSIRPFSNGPYWSLGYEFWYYALFGTAYFLRGRLRMVVVSALSLVIGPKILLLFPVWLMGVWAYRAVCADKTPITMGWLLFLGSTALYVFFRIMDGPKAFDALTIALLGEGFFLDQLEWSQQFLSSYFIGTMVALNFVGAGAIASRASGGPVPLEDAIRYCANYTFTLYLCHYPLLQFFAALNKAVVPAKIRMPVVLVGTIGVVWVIGSWTEKQKRPLKVLLISAYSRFAKRVSIVSRAGQ